MNRSLVEAIDRWRAQQPGVPTRAEAIRRLCIKTLERELYGKDEADTSEPGGGAP